MSSIPTKKVWFKDGKFGDVAVAINKADFKIALHTPWEDFKVKPKVASKPVRTEPAKPKVQEKKEPIDKKFKKDII